MRLNLFGLSGGKDSTRLVAWAIHESGYPRESLIFCFCDTENEYQEVYDQIRALDAYIQSHGCRPVVWLRASGPWVDKFWMFPLFLALAVWKGRFPSAKARFCTQFLKIKPTEKFIAELTEKHVAELQAKAWATSHRDMDFPEPFEIVSHSGVRASESTERSFMKEWAVDMFGCRTRRPILGESIEDVWRAHHKYKLPINPLYRAGWKRVGCRLCIMSNKKDVRRTVKQRPWVIAVYRLWENVMGEMSKERGSVSDFSSWFRRTNVPERYRSRLVNTKKGMMHVPTIDDVAAWSLTARGGKDVLMDFMHEEESFEFDDAHEPCKSGFCE